MIQQHGSADTENLTLAMLPADIIRMLARINIAESVDSVRLISHGWNSVVKDSIKMNTVRFCYTPLEQHPGHACRPLVFVDNTVYRCLHVGTNDPGMHPIEKAERERVVREVQRCTRIDKLGLAIEKIYYDSFDTLRTKYLGEKPVRLMAISDVQFFDQTAGRTLIKLMKSNKVQNFEARVINANTVAMRDVINDALTVVKSVKFYEMHDFILSESSSFCRRQQYFWEKFVQELNSKGIVHAEYHSENIRGKFRFSYQLRLEVKAIVHINN